MSKRDDYFARVAPLLGKGLAERTVAIDRPSLTARVVELLAGCMLRRVIVRDRNEPALWPLRRVCNHPDVSELRQPAAEIIERYFRWKNEFAPIEWLKDGAADVVISARLSPPGRTPRIDWDRSARLVTMYVPIGDYAAYQNLTYAVALGVRDILLERSTWPDGSVFHGTAAWPFTESRTAFDAPDSPPTDLEGRHILVVGCGSVGSEAIKSLSGNGARWTLVDDGTVSVFNPHRQWFGTGEIGTRKVEALARRLSPESVRAVPERLDASRIELLASLIDADAPDVVLLTTGTNDDAALAELLWQRAIAHVAAYAYPQARFFEVTTVLPRCGTPCLHCFRGNLFRGAESAAPMTDEIASFLYLEVEDGERDRLYKNLVAEPATPIETGRIADVVAQCALQALAPPNERDAWFVRMLEGSTNCLLGGSVVEQHDDGECAYGLTYPGQVVRLGLDDIMGVEEQRTCPVCERKLDVRVRLELPEEADGEEVDQALLAG